MSKPRYRWWQYVKNMIRAYPLLKREYEELHEQSVTANMSGMPGGGSGVSRGTEEIAVRELPYTKQREYEAVKRAVDQTSMMKNGESRLKIINFVYWKRSHTLEGAGIKVGYEYKTARKINGEFIKLVAKNYGLLDVEDFDGVDKDEGLPTRCRTEEHTLFWP